MYKITESDEKIIIKGIKDFDPIHIFECGQCFRWNKEEDGSYTGVAHGKILNVYKDGEYIIFDQTTKDDFINLWMNYFDLKRDYGMIKENLSKDPILKEAIKHGQGIRILNQDEWETTISFIISSNRGIPVIKKSIEALCEKYGTYIGVYRGRKYYDFPTPKQLLNCSEEDIKQSHTGYRAKYIVNTTHMIEEAHVDLYGLKNLSTHDARNELLKLSGVGPKVADCILLFCMGKYDAFPIDVWVKRVMEYFYLPEETSLKKVQLFSQEKFKNLAGFAQQYLFYYARELGIGKKSVDS
ncbi:DNA-3-methyladenine glycosylase family protein [Inediibacterium massiliense]|uniref:DNA-3-methyladenine glycosylase family protein n=1 Tax=Inediibacterium massiliense TaxID=1658111 RepID=UPI0006B46DE9|nr:DNA glycosylase [Inediibacterium massiliense]